MRTTALLRIVWLIASLSSSAATPLLHAASLAPAGQITVGTSFPSAPKWSGGALLSLDANQTAQPVVHVYSGGGKEANMIRLNIQGASAVHVLGMDHRNGVVALCGTTQDVKLHAAGYVALAYVDGRVTTLIRTEPYSPHNVAFAPDGTFWTIGAEVDPTLRKPTNTGVGVLRHFSPSGTLITSLIPQSSLAVRDLVSGLANLAASSSAVGWYQSSGHHYFEITPDSQIHQYAVVPLGSVTEKVWRIGITDNGQVFVTKRTAATEQGTGTKTELYTLDRTANLWVRVQFPGTWQTTPSYWLHGVSGNTLAFSPIDPHVVQFFEAGQQ